MIEFVISDVHLPYEDRSSYNLTLEVIKDIQPDLLYILGDYIDFYSVSQYSKDPARKQTLQSDIDYTIEELTRLRKILPKSDIVYHSGNHDDRLQRYLNSKAEELSNLKALKLEKLLELEKNDIKFISNGSKVRIGKLWHLHGNEVAGSGVNVARAKFLKLNANIIFGHHHKLQSYVQRDYEGNIKGAWANPCLCDVDAEYAHFTDWVQGFSIIEYTKTGNFNVDQIAIVKSHPASNTATCYVRGKEYEYRHDGKNANKNAPYAERKVVEYKGLVEVTDF